MTPQLHVVAIIPARGGSKGLPGKNLRLLHGKPLLAYTIEAATQCACVDRAILTTDSPEIAEVGKRYGAEVPWLRPAELARDGTHTPPVIEHAVSYLETKERYPVDIIVTLQPTSPFRGAEQITAAVDHLMRHPHLDSVISIHDVVFPPFWMLRREGDCVVPFVSDGVDYSLLERQQLPMLYQPNGAIYVTRRTLLRDHGVLLSAFRGGKTGFVVMDWRSSIDIDTELDFVSAEAVAPSREKTVAHAA